MTGEKDDSQGVDVRVRRVGERADSDTDTYEVPDPPEEERARAVVEAVVGDADDHGLEPAEEDALTSVARTSDVFPVPVADVDDGVSLSTLGAALVEPTEEAAEARDVPSLLDAVRDALWVARIIVSTTRSAAGYSLRSGVRTGARMLRAAGTSRSLEEFVRESQRIAYDEMDRVGFDVLQEEVEKNKQDENLEQVARLRERGGHLLELSADVEHEESVHPAYPKILDQLAPDEARILRFLATEGPQPVVNVRDAGWIPIASELVGAGLSMIGTEAGCRYEDRTQAYLNNLQSLGLVWFSDESVEDVRRYQLVEAQPKVMAARDECKRPKVVRRSLHLTPFGVDFCRVCLPLETEISKDASSVYHPPDERFWGNEDEVYDERREPDETETRDVDRIDSATLDEEEDEWRSNGHGYDEDRDIRNPHLHNHWQSE